MELIRRVKEMQETCLRLKKERKTIGLVPTMGYLHAGHLSLVQRARKENDIVVMSNFVNPLQFGPKEDFATYPRDLERDNKLAAEVGVDYVFAPTAEEMYPGNYSTYVEVTGEVTGKMCGISRPGHFKGVTTVVCKLFLITQADRAYFGQKDLSSTGEGFETDLVEKLVGEKLRTLRDEIETQRQHVRDAAQRWLKLSNTAELRRDYQSQLTDANFRLKKFEEYGVADKLQKRLGFQQDASALARMKERADSFVLALGQLIAEHEDDLRNATSYVSKQNPDFFTAYYAEFANLVAKVDQLKQIEQEARAVTSRLQFKQGEFDAARQSLQEEFAQVERQLAQELKQTGMTAIQPDDFLTQQQRKTKAEQMLEALAKQESQQSSIRDALFAEIDKLNGLWLREFNAIKAELDRVNAGHTALQIEADFKGDKEAAIGFMQQLFKGSNIRETTLRAVMEDYADFGGLLRDLPNALKKAGSTPEVFEKTFMQNLMEFVVYQVPNRFVIRYRGKELKHHSLGQRASALLLYVLSQRQNDVIIIDQPEDDLDNQTIYDDVIKLLREMKPHAQFIFATHNANFPVLGDAEQVHACRYQDEQVAVQSGSIDARPVQDAIINIMEGGQEAFNRRKEVYNLWKPQN